MSITHNLPLIKLSTAVGRGHDGAADLQVPGFVSILCGAGDGDGVDTTGVTVAWTVIALTTAVSGRPDKNGPQAFATLYETDGIELRGEILHIFNQLTECFL